MRVAGYVRIKRKGNTVVITKVGSYRRRKPDVAQLEIEEQKDRPGEEPPGR